MMTRLARSGALLILASLFCARSGAPEYRAQWLDGFHAGYMTPDQVTTSVSNLRRGNCNVMIPEILVNKFAQYVYYNPDPAYYPDLGGTILSNGVPITCDLKAEPETNSTGDFDALADCVAKAHDTSGGGARLDVWAWLVTFRAAGPVLWNHPEWVTVNSTGSDQTDFDPGHPGVEQQIYNVCMDLVTHYDIDGLNFDYIRYVDRNNGLNDISVRRYNARHGTSGIPSTTSEDFKQWRRDQVTSVLRKIYLNAIDRKPGLRITADTITWTPSPQHPAADDPNPSATWKANFEGVTAAYRAVYQDWRGWMEEGILDIAIPMAYFRNCQNAADYENWQDFAKENQFGRQCMIGPGTYLNTIDDALFQLKRSRAASVPQGRFGAGSSIYSYASPYAATCGGSIVPDPEGMADALAHGTPGDPEAIYPDPAPLPVLPRLTNGKGHLMGTVWDGTAPRPGWIDGATVTLSGPATRTMQTDGTGFYGFVDLPPGDYTVTVSATGEAARTGSTTVAAGRVTTLDVPMAPYALPPLRPFTAADVARALSISAGMASPSPDDMALNIDASGAPGRIDMADAQTLMRKLSGLQANP